MSDEGKAAVVISLWTIAFNAGILLAAGANRAIGFMLTVVLREVLDNDHYMMEYFVDDHSDEWVDITFDNEYIVRKVNVTADSLLALTRDVLKHF